MQQPTQIADPGWKRPPEFPQLCRYLGELSPQPMIAVEGPTHIVRYTNPAFRKLVGLSDDKLLTLPFSSAVPEPMANGCGPLLTRVYSTGTPESLAEQEHHSDSEATGAEAAQQPVYWSYFAWAIQLPTAEREESNAIVGVMIQVTDSTEIGRFRRAVAAVNEALLVSAVRQHVLSEEADKLAAELRLSEAKHREAQREAESANRAKDMFLATLSHELRTPLNAIVGWMSILQQMDCNDEDLHEGLDVIDRNTKTQVQLIDDVLDVSRIVSGKLRLEVRPCDLIEIIKAGIEVVRPAADAKKITVHTNFDPSASQSSCDAARIQQVVWNLVANAVKFTPSGGKVFVTLTREPSSLKIRVKDTGQGMEPELVPYVFDRFRQADSSTRRRFGGLGLGLSIVKQLVEMHGGTVVAQSEGLGAGASFLVNLPIVAIRLDEEDEEPHDLSNGPRHASHREVSVVRLDGISVMVVDDEGDARRVLSKVLTQAGAVVTAAESVASAMRALLVARPDVLVSDLGMAGEDGYDLIRQVRASGYGSDVLPAVALTAFVQKEDQRQVLLAGFQVHVSKPVDPHDLTAVIAAISIKKLLNPFPPEDAEAGASPPSE